MGSKKKSQKNAGTANDPFGWIQFLEPLDQQGVVEIKPKERQLFPLNTDYDLFSLGPDHQTAVSLGDAVGLDDVIRANNGGYFGLASNY